MRRYLVPPRNEVRELLKENNVLTRMYFYPLTNTLDCYSKNYDVEKTPVALNISKRVLALPLYSDLSLEDVDRICKIIISARRV